MGQAVSTGPQVVPIMEETASEEESPWSPSDQLQNELHHAAETACKEVFPFEKLPPELQMEILRFAIPRALRSGSRPQWVKGANGTFETRDREPLKGEHVPVSLFRTSRSMSAMALWIFYSEVPLQIDVFIYVVWYNQEKRHDWAGTNHLASALQIQDLPQFRCLRNYHINCTLEDWWFEPGIEMECFRQLSCVYKERFRLICDALAHNPAIKALTVFLPCFCWLPKNERLPHADFIPSVTGHHAHGDHSQTYARILDILSPLTRLKVAEPVVFRTIFNHGKSEFQVDRPMEDCTRLECKKLALDVQQALGRLDGNDLLDEEKEWKRVKELDRGNPHMRSPETVKMLDQLWARLSELQYYRGVQGWPEVTSKGLFDSLMKQAEESICKDYRRWQKARAKERREESLRRFREEGPVAKLWSGGLQKEYDDLRKRKHRSPEDSKWLMMYQVVFESKERERRRLTREWHQRNPPVPGLENSDDDGAA